MRDTAKEFAMSKYATQADRDSALLETITQLRAQVAQLVQAVADHVTVRAEQYQTIQRQAESIEYWKADSAAAWDKCEERRFENVKQAEALRVAREALDAMLCQFTKTPSSLKDTEARGLGHKALAAIDALPTTVPAQDALTEYGVWQPIETAPKDGTRIKVRMPPHIVDVSFGKTPCGDDFVWLVHENAWLSESPSEWMPLPKPDAKGGE